MEIGYQFIYLSNLVNTFVWSVVFWGFAAFSGIAFLFYFFSFRQRGSIVYTHFIDFVFNKILLTNLQRLFVFFSFLFYVQGERERVKKL